MNAATVRSFLFLLTFPCGERRRNCNWCHLYLSISICHLYLASLFLNQLHFLELTLRSSRNCISLVTALFAHIITSTSLFIDEFYESLSLPLSLSLSLSRALSLLSTPLCVRRDSAIGKIDSYVFSLLPSFSSLFSCTLLHHLKTSSFCIHAVTCN